MADDDDRLRVLVVDDAAAIRAVIRRVLTSGGYRVDEAGTLDEARAMAPGGYDAVLVDLHLGSQRGADLVEELVAADPGFASRCLVMSGNPAGIPPGVAALGKPFLPRQLLEAVRALHRPRPGAAGGAGTDGRESAPGPEQATGIAPAQTLLDMATLLRERERGAFADALHAGPVQDLAVALMDLQLIRQQLPARQQELLDPVARQVGEAAMFLRELMRLNSPFWLEETPPAETIRKRTGWLLAAPPAVTIRPSPEAMSEETARLVASVAELALFLVIDAAASSDPRPHARIGVSATAQGVDIEIIIDRAPRDRRLAPSDGDRLGSLLDELGSALGADVYLRGDPDELRVAVSLRRPAGQVCAVPATPVPATPVSATPVSEQVSS